MLWKRSGLRNEPERQQEKTLRNAMRCVALLSLVIVCTKADAAEWKNLFNGQDLSGWKAVDGPLASWKVEDGLLYCSGGGGGWLSTTDEYGNFELHVEFRVPP